MWHIEICFHGFYAIECAEDSIDTRHVQFRPQITQYEVQFSLNEYYSLVQFSICHMCEYLKQISIDEIIYSNL